MKIIQAADYDVSKAEYGIIYIDEIDKITKKSECIYHPRCIKGKRAAGAFKDSGRNHCQCSAAGRLKASAAGTGQIDTTNILFICGGAFDGLEKIIDSRLGLPVSIGFNSDIVDRKHQDIDELQKQVMPQDLTKFGPIRSLLVRVPITVSLQTLNEEALVRILREPKNALIKQYQALLDLDGVKLEFTDDALMAIAHMAVERKKGARGLRSYHES